MTAPNPYAAGITNTSIANVIGTPVFGSPWDAPQVWDTITLSGTSYGPLSGAMTASASAAAGQVPIGGKVRVRHAGRVYKFDKKDGPGQQGYTTTYIGIKPRLFAIEFYIWTSAQFDY